ncbi:hypothetical protein [uncultured Nevskia sp.]|uniref:hypothetical protein n=1 Tax=uncultured Nevskia sp. TaxID=228950 RepID=UPI0025F39679|nr:hypothetical protein [uncultured Nevskia sp.]
MSSALAMTMFGRTVRISIVSLLTAVMLLLPVSLAWCCMGSSMPAGADCAAAQHPDAPATCLSMAAEFGKNGIVADTRHALIRPQKSARRFPALDGDQHPAPRPSATVLPVSAHVTRFLTAAIPPPVPFHRPLYLQTARLRL